MTKLLFLESIRVLGPYVITPLVDGINFVVNSAQLLLFLQS